MEGTTYPECNPLHHIVIIVVCLFTFFVNNTVITPDIMESRNLVTAQEMVHDGHWLIPTMNGELRLEKPPLPTWITATAEAVAPNSLALQRGVAGLAALLLVFYFGRFAWHILRISPLLPVLLLCTCYSMILIGRTASWDIYCHAFMMGGIYHLARAFQVCKQSSWRHFLAAGSYIGLSIMSKGPVSLYALFLPFLLSFCYFYRPRLKGHIRSLIVMVLIALIVGTWWYIYLYIVQGEALSAVIQKESGSWVSHNVRPWWYYWKFFLEAGVWSLLLLTAIFLPLADHKRRNSRTWLFALCWMLGSLLLLSLMPEKKSRYLFPLLIPACYVMGCMLTWWQIAFKGKRTVKTGTLLEKPRTLPQSATPLLDETRTLPVRTADRWCFRFNAGLVMIALLLLPVAAWRFVLNEGYVSLGAWIAFTIFCLALAAYLLRAMVKLHPLRLLGSVTVLFLVAEAFVLPSLVGVINNPEMESISRTQDVQQLRGIPFYHDTATPLRIEIVYAAHRRIRPLDMTNADSLHSKLPCAVLTHQRVGNLLPAIWDTVDTVYIGRFDDNHRPRGNRRYSDEFIYHVTLLRAKTTKSSPAMTAQ